MAYINGRKNFIIATHSVLNYCRGDESGTVVGMHDVFDIQHNVKVKLRSKNLIQEQYDNYYGKMLSVNLEKGKTYTVSCTRPKTESHYLFLHNGEESFQELTLEIPDGENGSYRTFTALDNTTHVRFDWGVGGVVTGAMIEEGATLTEYTPYVADDAPVTIYTGGKNLLPFPYDLFKEAITIEGVTFTPREDGGIILNGTSANMIGLDLSELDLPFDLGYAVSKGGFIANETIGGGVQYARAQRRAYLRIWENNTYNNVIFYPQIEIGNVSTDYEKYKAGETITTTIAEGATLKAVAPNMSIYTIDSGVVMDVEYIRDANRYIEELEKTIISLGGSL